MKVIAFYLPQFHSIPENDKWWGRGFTEWVNMKKAKPLFEGHYQPRVPLNGNYYDLSNVEVMRWQADLAKKHGLYGFCFYHYWFNGHMLLEKPVENWLKAKDIDFPYCICWANGNWTQAWVSKQNKILIEQKYAGKSEWKAHFDYFLPFFKDKRYIKNDGKPLFVIYRPEIIGCLNEMLDYWQELAKDNGLEGIDFAFQHFGFDLDPKADQSRFKYNIEYQPGYAIEDLKQQEKSILRIIKRKVVGFAARFGIDISYIREPGVRKSDYDRVWDAVLRHQPKDDKCVPGAFVDWDNTPRRQTQGSVFVGATPEKFKKYMTEQIKRTREVYNKDYIFLFAWNEWAEGGYLEPDEKFGYGYLEGLKSALIENKEFPW